MCVANFIPPANGARLGSYFLGGLCTTPKIIVIQSKNGCFWGKTKMHRKTLSGARADGLLPGPSGPPQRKQKFLGQPFLTKISQTNSNHSFSTVQR